MLQGIDVSHHKGRIDWPTLARRAPHIRFSIAKVTEGLDFTDSEWERNVDGALEHNIVPGVYHFLRSDSDPEHQAHFFLDTVGNVAGKLIIIDVELSGMSRPLASHVYKFQHVIHNAHPFHPFGIYTGAWYWRDMIGNPPGNALGYLWHSRYRKDPGPLYGGWDNFTMWQYTSMGVVPGISTTVDMNYFYGNEQQLQYLTQGYIPIVPPAETRLPDMMLVRNQESGAVLHLLGAATAVLVDNPEDFKDMINNDIPMVNVKPSQFHRYEVLRIDK